MKTLFLIVFLSFSLFGSMGDCLRCHPKLLPDLQNDKRHKPMQTCIKCHEKNKDSTPECGDKCFSCHTKDDMQYGEVAEHKVFEDCRECHVTQVENIFNPAISHDQSHKESLQDFLLK
jgi:hypothetical protein